MTSPAVRNPPEVIDFDQLPAVECPCGTTRRALTDRLDFPGTIHRTEIDASARRHYHRGLTETYYILECDAGAALELDGELVPLRPGLCVMIPPMVRHRGVGRISALIFVLPKFDPADEWFDSP